MRAEVVSLEIKLFLMNLGVKTTCASQTSRRVTWTETLRLVLYVRTLVVFEDHHTSTAIAICTVAVYICKLLATLDLGLFDKLRSATSRYVC